MNRLGFEVPSVGSNPVRHGRRNPRVSNEAVFEVEDDDLGRMGRARLLWDPTPLNPHPQEGVQVRADGGLSSQTIPD